ncbi:unnamed protein product [Ceutorhynchus assimilis]|uniref:Cyclic nucleotide-binding domain-containing protein n=1 Tax=Ceutorhynchus assimilis TaxID=467358 RepID=A0A9N9QCH4_9CUCU|nr:unnamed protein product [Ceutorhynchus assimilis]
MPKISSQDKVLIKYTPFSKYGHDCTLEEVPEEFEYGNIPSKGCINKCMRWIIRMCTVSESSKMYTHHLRSYGAICKERQRQAISYGFRIHPFSRAYLIWSFILMFAILALIFCTSLDFLFYNTKNAFVFSIYWRILESLLTVIFIINVMLSFFTGYYDEPKQEVILEFKLVVLQYLKTSFFTDLLACVPANIGASSKAGIIILKVLHCFKYLMIIRFHKHFKYCAEILDVNYYTYMITLVIVNTLLYWHVLCCMLKFSRERLGSFSNKIFLRSRTMFHIAEREASTDYPVLSTLLGAFYRGSLVVYNSSYGKVLPATEAEILLVWFGWYLSSLFFIYILAMIMEIMKGKTSASHKYVEMERQLKDYMRHKQLPMQMRTRILIYYEFRFQKSYFRENEILDTISEQLRQEINMHACRKLVENVIFFRNLPINLLVRIISCLRIEVYLVNDIIIKANTPGTSMYFISTGTVAIYTKSGKEICHLEDGSHFGEIALIIKDTLRTASVIAVEVSEIYRLDQKDFVKAINPYPDLLANIQHIAAERMEVAIMLDDYNKKEHSAKR